MDYRTSIPTYIPLITFCIFLILVSIPCFFTNPKKRLYFSLSSFFIWFICLGIGFLFKDPLAKFISGFLPINLFPGEWTSGEIADFISPYTFLVSQWIFILIFYIPQTLIWHLWLKKIWIKAPEHKKDIKKHKNKNPKTKEQIRFRYKLGMVFATPILALPSVTQVTYVISMTTTSKVNFQNKATSVEKNFKSYLEFCVGALQPSLITASYDVEAIFSTLKLNNEYFNGRKIIEWYGDFFGNFFKKFQNLDFSNVDQFDIALSETVDLINDWNYINNLYVTDFDNLFLSEVVGQEVEKELLNLIGSFNPKEISDSFINIEKGINSLINGFTILKKNEPVKRYSPLKDFSVSVSSKTYAVISKILDLVIFNDEYQGNKSENKNRLLSYFFKDKNLKPIPVSAMSITSFFNITDHVPDITGDGTKINPYIIPVSYFNNQSNQKTFCYQLSPIVNPSSASPFVNWSFELSPQEQFDNNQWIKTPTAEDRGSILINYSGIPVMVTPIDKPWGITWTISNGNILSSYEFFWRYV